MDAIVYLIIAILAIVLGKPIVDFQFEISKRNRYLVAQIKLLALIAAAQGINIDKIAEIVTDAKLEKTESDHQRKSK